MIHLTYDSTDGTTRPDGQWVTWYKKLVSDPFWVGTFGNSLPFSLILTGIAKGEINHESVVFYFGDESLTPNQYGVLNKYPSGFCDMEITLAEERLIASVQKVRGKK